MSVPDRDALTDCEDELHRLVRDMNTRERYINDLEQHVNTLISLLHREHSGRYHATFPYCKRQMCKHTTELLGIEPKVTPK